MPIPAPLLLLLLLLPSPSSSAFSPADNYLISCGATATTTFLTRDFLPDSSSSSGDSLFSLSSPSSVPLRLPTPAPNSSTALYHTARAFRRPSSYSFPSLANGTHVLRLHFSTFSSSQFDLSRAQFSVSALAFRLLRNFSVPSLNTTVVKEFLLPISSGSFELTFSPADSSFAFASAIELFSAPTELLADTGKLVGAGAASNFDGLLGQVLETAYRINVGGDTIDPSVDTLWRTWLPDDDYLNTKSAANRTAYSGLINYQASGLTREVAPDGVYRTAQQMSNASSTIVSRFNITWNFSASSGSRYLIRLHFCDIVGLPHQLTFNVYIDNYSAYKDLDLWVLSNQQLAAPFYFDFVAEAGGTGLIRVSVGPPDTSTGGHVNAILNGLEMMKLNGEMSSQSQSKSKKNLEVIIGLVAGGFALFCLLMVALFVIYKCKRKEKKKTTAVVKPTAKEKESGGWSPMPGSGGGGSTFSRVSEGTVTASPAANLNLGLLVPIADLLLATNGFDEKSVIGHGGFGNVYKGVLKDGTKVAVKRSNPNSKQGLNEFMTEITVFSKIRHRHLVSLIGFCEEQGEMILVYEFMENGSLKSHLYGSDLPCLSWKQRLEICVGTARGLHYLHTGSAQGIIHRDVKSANILLDENFQAKVADFGLSRSVPQLDQTHVSTNVKGSFGYLDPEYFRLHQLTDKSDVYSFGVVLFEVLCARPALDPSLAMEQVNLVEWAMQWQRRGQLEDIVDPKLAGKINPSSLRKFGETAAKCVEEYGVDRPTMGDVLWNLEYALQLQVTSVKREPYEDSSTSVSNTTTPPVERVPSSKSRIDYEGVVGRSDGSSEMSTSGLVFSQLITNEGR